MTDYYSQRRGVLASETVIDRAKLAELERKAAVVDRYEDAARKMRDRQAVMLERRGDDPYADGWLDALREFSELVIRDG